MSAQAEIPAKEGERIVAASRRPDGTLRKPVRIRAGYTPQDEVAVYQSKGALFKQGPSVPPGYDDDAASKPKTRAAKKNEKRKEKKQQAVPSGSRTSEHSTSSGDAKTGAAPQGKATSAGTESGPGGDMGSVVEQLSSLDVSHLPKGAALQEDRNASSADLEKRLRALRKKIRFSESLRASHAAPLTPEQLEKLSKLPTWREELQDLEAMLAALNA